MSTREWNKESVESVLDQLNGLTRGVSNLKDFVDGAPVDATYNGLSKACKRWLGQSLSQALAERRNAPEAACAPLNKDKDSLHHDILVAYTSKANGGLGLTAFETAVKLTELYGVIVTEEDVKQVVKDRNHSKSKTPVLVDQNIDMVRERFEVLSRDANQKHRSPKKLIAELERQVASLQSMNDLYQKITDLSDTIEPLVCTTRNKSKDGLVLVLPVSDVHSGATNDGLKSNPLYQKRRAQYNRQILLERQEELHRSWERMFERLTASELRRLDVVHYLSLGDDIDGVYSALRQGQFLDQDEFGFEQVRLVRDFHFNNIWFLMDLIDRMRYRANLVPVDQDERREEVSTKMVISFTPGNHDRMYADKSYSSENFMACLFADNVKMLLEKQYVSISPRGWMPKFTCNAAIPMVSCLYESIGNVNLIAHHGHLFDVKSDKDINNLAHIHGVKKASRYVIVQGHLHHFKAHQAANAMYIWNPSYCGNTQYGTIQVQKSSPPQAIGILLDSDDTQILGPYILGGE